MTEQKVIEIIKREEQWESNSSISKAFNMAIEALEEVQQYRAIGTVEELQKAEKEEDILKFYYCDSEDSYLVGLRIDNFYYAHYIDGRWVFDMSRHLPWGKHVVDDTTAWKEYTYPSEPREINFSEWLNGFIKKECGGTPEECREAVEKQTEIRNKAIDEFAELLKGNLVRKYANGNLTQQYVALQVTDWCNEISEQLKERSSDDVCEWKNAGTNDNWKPSCEPNETFNVFGVAWFNRCPYCGKKIKVVE